MKLAVHAGVTRKVGPAASVAVLAATSGLPAMGHVLSVSHGSLLPDGRNLQYELRMPLVEAPQGTDRARLLLGAFDVLDGERTVTQSRAKCSEDLAGGLLVCTATYRFPEPPAAVRVRCEFPAVTVPQHIHVLRSGEAEMLRQTVFDFTNTEAEIRFSPPTWLETATSETGAGVRRVLTSPELLLFLVALALAGRSRPELMACGGSFIVAQALVGAVGGLLGWLPPLRFLEAAAALTVAYVASEILFLPTASKRWLACAAMGTFHGLFLATLLGSANLSPTYFVPGSLCSEAMLLTGLGMARLRYLGPGGVRLGAALLLVGGIGWFGWRVIG